MCEFLGKREIVSLALQDHETLKFAKKRIRKEKAAAERIREFWKKRRTNYKHRDDKFPIEEILQVLKVFKACTPHSPKKYVLTRETDTVNLLRVKGTNVRSCTISDTTGHKIMKFHLVPCNKEKTFILELPESLPMVLVVYRQILVEFDADSIANVEQKGEFMREDVRQTFSRKEYQLKHECSANGIIGNGSITYFD
ncbi:hypothetical protein B1750_gp053 [Noumeavirus]|uniref:hypothetical protein n=1 Tax=Noumeavirus TaxID=1955558 RepID=UPI000982F4F3|nr:hypothetical protein B1750_gp053 [Noumeavirus]AQM73034.1 hypothetical protein NMV_053 [Noumeavirus]